MLGSCPVGAWHGFIKVSEEHRGQESGLSGQVDVDFENQMHCPVHMTQPPQPQCCPL